MANNNTRTHRQRKRTAKYFRTKSSNLRNLVEDLVELEVSRQMSQPRTVEINERFFDFSDYFPADFVPKFTPKEYFEKWQANCMQ